MENYLLKETATTHPTKLIRNWRWSTNAKARETFEKEKKDRTNDDATCG
jgi:hypothetical protein